MNKVDDDKPIPIAEKFRVSLDGTDAEAHARLLANDAEQLALAERINSPFTQKTPQDTEKSKALITIKALSVVKRTPEQDEQFAECWAMVGRYDVAAKVSKLHKKHYSDLHKALTRKDGDWCKHDKTHQYVKAHHGDKSLVACNFERCGFSNIISTPEHLKRRQRASEKHQGKTKGMDISQSKQYHTDHV